MHLTVENIGKVAKADIEISGITVIAGENNTGKSTIGKALFCLFNCFHDPERRIKSERRSSISRALSRLFDNAADAILGGSSFYFGWDTDEVAEQILSKHEQNGVSVGFVRQCIVDSLEKNQPEAVPLVADDGDEIADASQRIIEILEVPDESLFRAVLTRSLLNEFNGQINNIYTEAPAAVELVIKDVASKARIDNDSVVSINNILHLRTEAVYLDDPFVIDSSRTYGWFRINSDHRSHLRQRLNGVRRDDKTEIDRIIASSKIQEIYSVINRVLDGDIVVGDGRNLRLRVPGSDKLLDACNLSSGLKTFAIIKQLLLNGTIEDSGTIILDEPEIHLHPEWQIVFAELIVLLQKKFSLHILLNTHSPYFLNAIQVYAERYQVSDVCHFYQATLRGGVSVINDVSGDVEKLYAQLAAPFQILEDVAYGA